MNGSQSKIPELVQKYSKELLDDWLQETIPVIKKRPGRISESELRRESEEFLSLLEKSTKSGNLTNIYAPEWSEMRDFLAGISRSRANQDFTPAETATFVFSIKKPLFSVLRKETAQSPDLFADEIWTATTLIDQLGLYITEEYQKSREAVISRQQKEMLELSTPVVQLWEGVLAVPLIGTLDSARTQVVMENLLQKIADTGSSMAIIDITGVPTVDTLVAQHLLKTVAAARLMGAECLISGIRPTIAQTIVHLGVAFPDVVTRASLADALALALKRMGLDVSKPA